MNCLDKEIIKFYQGAEYREQDLIVMITKLQMENKRLKKENEKLRGEVNG